MVHIIRKIEDRVDPSNINEEVDIVNRAVHGSLGVNGVDVEKAIWWGVSPSGGYSDKSIENEYKEDKLTYKSKVKIIQIGVGLGIIKRMPLSSRGVVIIAGDKPKAPEELQEELSKRIADEVVKQLADSIIFSEGSKPFALSYRYDRGKESKGLKGCTQELRSLRVAYTNKEISMDEFIQRHEAALVAIEGICR